jgi:hypothetical protein
MITFLLGMSLRQLVPRFLIGYYDIEIDFSS